MVRLVPDHRLFRVPGDHPAARGAEDGLGREETAGMEPEKVALQVDEDRGGGSNERVSLTSHDQLTTDVARDATLGRALELGAILCQAPEPPACQSAANAVPEFFAGQHDGAKPTMRPGWRLLRNCDARRRDVRLP